MNNPSKYKPSDESLEFWRILRPHPDERTLILKIKEQGVKGLKQDEIISILKELRKKDLWEAIKTWHQEKLPLGSADSWQEWSFLHSFKRRAEMLELKMIQSGSTYYEFQNWLKSRNIVALKQFLEQADMSNQESCLLVKNMVDCASLFTEQEFLDIWELISSKVDLPILTSALAYHLIEFGELKLAYRLIEQQPSKTLLDLQGIAQVTLSNGAIHYSKNVSIFEKTQEKIDLLELLFKKGLPITGLGKKTLIELWFEKNMEFESYTYRKLSFQESQKMAEYEKDITSFFIQKNIKDEDLSQVLTIKNTMVVWIKELFKRRRLNTIMVLQPFISQKMYLQNINDTDMNHANNLLELCMLSSVSLLAETLKKINPFELPHVHVKSLLNLLFNQPFLGLNQEGLKENLKKDIEQKYKLLEEFLPSNSPYASIFEEIKNYHFSDKEINYSSKQMLRWMETSLEKANLQRTLDLSQKTLSNTSSSKIRL